MRALEFITSHVIYKPSYTYKFQLKTTLVIVGIVYKVFVVTRIEKDDSGLDTNVNLNRFSRQISKDSVTSF